MVNDKMDNLIMYIPDSKKEKVKGFLEKVSFDMEEGRYEIDGDEIYAQIMSYPTKLISECTIEAHNIYCDIQFSLKGEEGISIFERSKLILEKESPETDFYNYGLDGDVYVRVNNKVGYFTMIKPSEAHRPQESIDNSCAMVKKGVIKIRGDLV